MSVVVMPLLPLLLPASHDQLDSQSQGHYRRNREAEFGELFGGNLEEWTSPGPVRERQWNEVRKGLSNVSEWMTLGGNDKPFITGDKMSYADLFIAAWLMWVKRILGSDSSEWVELMTWDNARWGKLMGSVGQYERVQ